MTRTRAVRAARTLLAAVLVAVSVADLPTPPAGAADDGPPADTVPVDTASAEALPADDGTAGAAATTTSPGPFAATTTDFPDPEVLLVDAGYYAYSTNSGWGNVPVIRSADLVTWTGHAGAPAVDALPVLPSWAAPGYTWAPSVVRVADGYVLFYATRVRASGLQCISRATSPSPEGPFVDRSSGPLVCQTGSRGSIDPSVFTDPSGARWLIWKSEGVAGHEPTMIWSQPLSSDAAQLLGEPSRLMYTDQPWEEPIVENPVMVAAQGRYYLFYSANRWQTAGYAEGFAVCESPAGPCVKPLSGPWLRSTATAAGPGGAEVVRDERGGLWLAYHAWTPGRVGYLWGVRSLRVEQLRFERGWPVTPSSIGPGSGFVDSVVVDVAAAPAGGYRLATTRGVVVAEGAASDLGGVEGIPLHRWVVGIESCPPGGPTGSGYWLVASDGGVFSFGDAAFFGSTGGIRLNEPIVGMAATPSGGGYWLVASDGGVFAFGDAAFFGSTGGIRLNEPIVGMAATPSGGGYWLVARDGGVFAFGDAAFFGSTGGIRLNEPIVGMAATPSGGGYWLVAADGGLFCFGDATFLGSTGAASIPAAVVAMAATPSGDGYWLAATDGSVYSFGAAA